MEEKEIHKIKRDLDLESLSTIQKVLILQRLLKEMTAKKKIFIDSKEKLISKINDNCYKYFEGRIKTKKSFDYINNNESKNYILIKNNRDILANLYKPIYNFYFLLQNDNSLMLKLIELCDEIYFEDLSDFFVHFLYVNIINFSFFEGKLIHLIYLLLEKLIMKTLPDKIEINNDIPIKYLKNTFLSYVFKSLTRKIDVRNFLSSVLNKYILRIESIRMTLSIEIKKVNQILNLKSNYIYRSLISSNGSLKDNEIHIKKKRFKGFEGNKKINNNFKQNTSLRRAKKIILEEPIKQNEENDDNNEGKKESKTKNNIIDEYEIIDEKGEIAEQKKDDEKPNNIFKKRTNKEEAEKKEEDKKDKKEEPNKLFKLDELKIEGKTPSNDIKPVRKELYLYQSLNMFKGKSSKLTNSLINTNINKDDENNTIDLFFIENDIKKQKIKEKLEDYENYKENNINSAMKEYLNTLLKCIDEDLEKDLNNKPLKLTESNSKENFTKKEDREIFSSSLFIEELNSIRLIKSSDNFIQLMKKIRINHHIITKIIKNIINELYKNLLIVPYSIKCIFRIINDLLDKKYSKEKGNALSNYQKYLFKINFFVGNIILPVLENPYYNGILCNDIINEITKENLIIIYKIFDKMITGNLFNKNQEPSMTIYNSFIIETLPKLFEIVDNFGENIELPNTINNFINSINNLGDDSSNNINYDYFRENPKESIEFQCICTSLSNLHIFYCLLEKNKEILIDKNNNLEQKKILGDLFDNIDLFMTKYLTQKEKTEGKIIEYFYLTKVLYSEQFKNEIENISNDNFFGSIPKNKDDLIKSYKKCMVEVFNYANKIQYENFYELTELKTQKTIKINKGKKSKKEEKEKNNQDKNLKKKYTNAIIKNLIKIIESKKDDDVDFVKVIFPQLRKNIVFEMNSSMRNQLSQRIIFCTNYLYLHMKNLPKKYIENNYSLLLDELIIETRNNIELLWSNLLFEFHKKIKEAERLNMISSVFNSQIKDLENLESIRFLYNNLLLPCRFQIEKDNSNIISNVQYQNSPEIQDEKSDYIILMDCKDQPIKEMINNIPDFREYESEYDNILDIEEKSQIPEAISSYFSSLRALVGKNSAFENLNEKNIKSIKDQLENYILNKLYDKLFPSEYSEEDLFIYKRCERLSFLKPENVIVNKGIINEYLLNEASKCFEQIDDKLTPMDKMKILEKGRKIIENSINFSSGKGSLGVDDLNQPLIYAMIKAKPKNLATNIQYIYMYLNKDQSKGYYGSILAALSLVSTVIKNLKYSDLIGVTEEKFGKDEFELDIEK